MQSAEFFVEVAQAGGDAGQGAFAAVGSFRQIDGVGEGPVESLKAAIGGARGGGTVVTAAGKAALAAFRRMEDKASKAIDKDVATYAGLLRKPGRGGSRQGG